MEQKHRKYSYAGWLLAFFAVLVFLSAPFSYTFWGGLFFHVSMAAVVAGLADWYAVVSLFRKPLGISYHTELIPRGRVRIIGMLRTMIEEELLTVPHLYRTVKHHSPGVLMNEWMQKHHEAIVRGTAVLLSGIFRQIKENEWVKAEQFLSEKMIRRIDWMGLSLYMAEHMTGPEKTLDICRLFSSWMQRLLNSDAVKPFFPLFYDRVWKDYESRGSGRGVVRSLLENQQGITDQKGGELIRSQMLLWAADLGRAGTPARMQAERRVSRFCARVRTDQAFCCEGNRWIQEQIISFLKLHPLFLETLRKHMTNQEAAEQTARGILSFLMPKLQEQMKTAEKRKAIDRWILFQSVKVMGIMQRRMGQAAEEELSRYTGEDMAVMAENSVSRDLQMIRINGSAVGAVLGGLFYLLSHLPEGGWFW